MSGGKKSIDSLQFSTRKNELQNINLLVNEFGDSAFRVIGNYYFNTGYEAGFERLTKLIENKRFSYEKFKKDPVKGISDFLHGYFKDRGGNLPKVWSEDNTVFLMTEIGVTCITIEAEKEVSVPHRDICNIYCRAFVKGMVNIFEDFYPGITINFYNAGSRRDKVKKDCIEAFQVIIA
ncbi:hypothetical protein ACFL4T_00725 [candidate division KSB1 bacterium]